MTVWSVVNAWSWLGPTSCWKSTPPSWSSSWKTTLPPIRTVVFSSSIVARSPPSMQTTYPVLTMFTVRRSSNADPVAESRSRTSSDHRKCRLDSTLVISTRSSSTIKIPRARPRSRSIQTSDFRWRLSKNTSPGSQWICFSWKVSFLKIIDTLGLQLRSSSNPQHGPLQWRDNFVRPHTFTTVYIPAFSFPQVWTQEFTGWVVGGYLPAWTHYFHSLCIYHPELHWQLSNWRFSYFRTMLIVEIWNAI